MITNIKRGAIPTLEVWSKPSGFSFRLVSEPVLYFPLLPACWQLKGEATIDSHLHETTDYSECKGTNKKTISKEKHLFLSYFS